MSVCDTIAPVQRTKFDKNVSPNWRPVQNLAKQPTGMTFSVRLRYWLISLAGLLLVALGVAAMALSHRGRSGGALVGFGLIVFMLGTPSRAVRNGYNNLD